ncbi:TPA: transposase domain-containing protein, partial [Escherichia coli]|nr:transposase domain-containing protein [Escherichia coli]
RGFSLQDSGAVQDVAERALTELVSSALKVIRTERVKKACTKCDCIVEAPAPSRPIERGIAGPGLLAHVLTGKYCEHLPLYRQSEIVCLGKKNYVFFGSDHGGERGALLYGLIDTCRLNGIDPEAYLRHILSVLPEWPSNRVGELLPWNVVLTNK